ncbi:hypothetical protein C9J48_00590 [Photobacterium profundum]|uniref:Uncharacterized protein n=1 Tax=Photobacterium profundum 3TCK TaxID=314280 RepID=Q1YY28_9GAMM|nr:hypothetical protein [Photobacterium profundum]EAS41177.1 hypothetical protein P3TCK_18689 [Photobacterium profundum 3TCK]PSV64000.1 hypothetical protein C9J48_00590 [Photobacterium profundum]
MKEKHVYYLVTFLTVFGAVLIKNYLVGNYEELSNLSFVFDVLLFVAIYMPLHFVCSKIGKHFTKSM